MNLMKKNNLFKRSPWETKSKDARNADSRIKFCKKCNMCWEIIFFRSTGSYKKQLHHYKNFPSYGKEKKICKECKGEKNGKNVKNKLFV